MEAIKERKEAGRPEGGPVKIEQASGKKFTLDPNNRIEIFDLYKVYKRESVEVVALRGLNLHVARGELLMIVGPSGCGKTTLLNLIGGLDKPTAGKIFVDRDDITDLSHDQLTRFRRRKIGFVFQFLNLVKSLNAKENVELPLISLGVPANERKARVDQLLDQVGLTERRLHMPSELSGGEQQRVAIATALANEPSIILADEPTGELDTSNAQEVMSVLRGLLEAYPEVSIIVVTHDLSLKKYADRIIKMRDGFVDESLALRYSRDESALESLAFDGDGTKGAPGFTREQIEEILPKFPLLVDVRACPACKSSNIVVTLLKSVSIEKAHENFLLRPVLLACNDCHHHERLIVKMLHA